MEVGTEDFREDALNRMRHAGALLAESLRRHGPIFGHHPEDLEDGRFITVAKRSGVNMPHATMGWYYTTDDGHVSPCYPERQDAEAEAEAAYPLRSTWERLVCDARLTEMVGRV